MPEPRGSKTKSSQLAIWLSVSLCVALAAGATGFYLGSRVSSARAARRSSVTTSIPRVTATTTTIPSATPATFSGSDGVKASWVVAQNKLPGTTSWKITGNSATGGISGFANLTYAKMGQAVTLYVSSSSATFQVFAYRMGYYGGTGARLIWTSANLEGVRQPPCTVAKPVNMVSCDNWSPSLKVTISNAFVQGDYLFKLVSSSGAQSYVPLTIWDPASTATYVVKNDVLTWQAWNPYGGYDFYTGLGKCPPNHYPLCTRARTVSFDRPYAYGNGAGDFLGNEYPLVYWAEKHGLDVTYWTDQTVVQHPTLLADHKAILSLGHDECWSLRERTAVENANHVNGLNVIFFGASAMLRHVRLQSSPLGSLREVVDYRNSYKDPLYHSGNPLEVTGNTWSAPPANWPESRFVGESYGGYLMNGVAPKSFVVYDASSWIFAGTGLKKGQAVPGVLASDFDSFKESNPHPSNLQILGHSPLSSGQVQTNIGPSKDGLYSDMTYYTDPASGGGVFDSGTNNWINSLSSCNAIQTCPSKTLRRITGNLLKLFGTGPSGDTQPSIANWQNF